MRGTRASQRRTARSPVARAHGGAAEVRAHRQQRTPCCRGEARPTTQGSATAWRVGAAGEGVALAPTSTSDGATPASAATAVAGLLDGTAPHAARPHACARRTSPRSGAPPPRNSPFVTRQVEGPLAGLFSCQPWRHASCAHRRGRQWTAACAGVVAGPGQVLFGEDPGGSPLAGRPGRGWGSRGL